MTKLTDKTISRFGIPRDWSVTEFTFHNPTNSECIRNVFQQNNLANVPTSPTFSAVDYPQNFHTITNSILSSPIAFSSVQNKLYLGDVIIVGNVIQVIHPITLAIEQAIAIPFAVKELAYSPVNNKIFGISYSTNQYFVIDCATNIIVNTTSIGIANNRLKSIAYNSIKNTFYVTDLFGNLHEISSATNLLLFSSFIGGAPYKLTFVPTKNDMYITLNSTQSVLDWDCVTNTAVGLPILVGGILFKSIEYCSAKNTVYTGSINGINEIDVVTNTLLATSIPLLALDFGYHVIGNVMYVSSSTSFSIIDCATNVVLRTYPSNLPNVDAPMFAMDTINNRVFSSADSPNPSGSNVYFVWETDRCYITGSEDYNEWVRSTFNDPMLIRRIQYISTNLVNLNQVLNKVRKDSNGFEFKTRLIPTLSISRNQYQYSIAQLEFRQGHLILGKGGDYFGDFTVQPNSEIKMVIYYKQTDNGAPLTFNKMRETVFGRIDFPHKKPKTWSNAELNAPNIPIMHTMTFNEWVKLNSVKPKKRKIKKIVSKHKQLQEEIIEYETKVYSGQAIVEDPKKAEFNTVKPVYVTRKHRKDKLEYEDIEFETKEYEGQAIVPFGSNVEYEQIKVSPVVKKPKNEREFYYEQIEIETQDSPCQETIEELNSVIISLVSDKKYDEIINKLKRTKKRKSNR